jgi:uncharacterized protein YoxC
MSYLGAGLSEEQQKLILQVVGQADVKRMQEELARLKKELSDIQQTPFLIPHEAMLQTQQITQRMQGLTAEIAKTKQELKEGADAVKGLNEALGMGEKATKGSKDALEAQGNFLTRYRINIVSAGYALNDFFSVQGGINQRIISISNNMPGVLRGFNMWGLALSGILPIIAQIIYNWKEISALWEVQPRFDAAQASMEELKKKIEEINKKPIKLAADISQLRAAEAEMKEMQDAQAAFKAGLDTTATKSAKEAAKTVVEDTIGMKALAKGIADYWIGTGQAMSHVSKENKGLQDEINQFQAHLKTATDTVEHYKKVGAPTTPETIEALSQARLTVEGAAKEKAKLDARMSDALAKASELKAGGYITDIGERAEVQGMIRQRPKLFTEQFAQRQMEVPGTPAEVEARQASIDAGKFAKEHKQEREEIARKEKQARANMLAMDKDERESLEKIFTERDRQIDKASKDLRSYMGEELQGIIRHAIRINKLSEGKEEFMKRVKEVAEVEPFPTGVPGQKKVIHPKIAEQAIDQLWEQMAEGTRKKQPVGIPVFPSEKRTDVGGIPLPPGALRRRGIVRAPKRVPAKTREEILRKKAFERKQAAAAAAARAAKEPTEAQERAATEEDAEIAKIKARHYANSPAGRAQKARDEVQLKQQRALKALEGPAQEAGENQGFAAQGLTPEQGRQQKLQSAGRMAQQKAYFAEVQQAMQQQEMELEFNAQMMGASMQQIQFMRSMFQNRLQAAKIQAFGRLGENE